MLPMIYPETEFDYLICAAFLAIVEHSPGIGGEDHLDRLVLIAHPDWMRPFINRHDLSLYDEAIADGPKQIFENSGLMEWATCGKYLRLREAVQFDGGTPIGKPIFPGRRMAEVKSSLPPLGESFHASILDFSQSALNRLKQVRSYP